MIILRQKPYTRAEREALKELLLKTRGFQRLPNGARMNARDVARFDKLAGDVLLWAKKGRKPNGVDLENARTFLEHADLGKSPKELERIAKKYSNKRALARWQRLKDLHPERGVNGISPERYARIQNNSSMKNLDIVENVAETSRVKRSDHNLLNNLAKDAKKNNVSVIRTNDDNLGNSMAVSLKGTRKLLKERNLGFDEAFDMSDLSKKSAKKFKSLVNSDADRLVILNKSAGPGIFAHELGHHRTLSSPSGEYLDLARKVEDLPGKALKHHNKVNVLHKRASAIGDSLGTVANESSATSYGLAKLKKHGATPEQLKKISADLGTDGTLGTYVNGGKSSAAKYYLFRGG